MPTTRRELLRAGHRVTAVVLLTSARADAADTTERLGGGPAPAAGRSLQLTAAIGLAVLVTGVVINNPTLVLVGLVTSATVLLRRWFPTDLALPFAVVGLVLAATVAGMAASVLGIDLLAVPWVPAGLYVSLASVVLARAGRSPRQSPAPGGSAWLALLPAGAAAAIGIVQGSSTDVARSWAFLGTDIVNHMAMVKRVQEAGSLDYSADAYPKGLHTLAALLSVPSRPVHDPALLLDYDLRLTAGLTWLALALLLWTGAVLARRLSALTGLPDGVPICAAVLLGAGAFFWNNFVGSFVYLGASPSLLAVVVLWLLPLAALVRTPHLRQTRVLIGTTCLAVAALAHLWQALVIVPVIAVALHAAPHLRLSTRAVPRFRLHGSGLVWALTTPPLLVLTGTPVLSVMTQHGASVAAIPGHVPPGPWRVLSLGLVCLVLLAAKDRSGAVRLIVGGALGLLASAAILLALAGGGLDLTQYYPQKVLWFLALFLSPLLVTVIAWALVAMAVPLWRSAGRLPHGFVLRSSLVALTTVVVLAGWLPWRIGAGIASVNALQVADDHSFNQPNRSAQRHEIATHYGPALQPRIVVPYVVGASAMVDPRGTQRVSSLLSFLTGQQAIAGDPPSVCKAIGIVAGTREAVVISKLPRSRVLANMRRNGCASRAEVLHVPGGIRDAAHSKY